MAKVRLGLPKSILDRSWFIWTVSLAAIQPDLLIHFGFGAPLFNAIHMVALPIIALELLRHKAVKEQLPLALIVLVPAWMVVSSFLNGANLSHSLKRLLLVTNMVLVTGYNMRRDAAAFVRRIYELLFACIAIHFLMVLLWPKGLYTTYYDYQGHMVPYLRHWFLSSGNNFILFFLPAILLDRLRLYRKGCKWDLAFVALHAMGLLCMLEAGATTSLMAWAAFLLACLLVEHRKVILPGLGVCVALALVLFLLLVYFDLGGMVGQLLGRDRIDFTGRTRIWAHAVQWIQFKPIFGYGYEFQELLIHKFGGNNTATHCHNLYLDLCYRSGIVSVVSFVAMLLCCAVPLERCKRKRPARLVTMTLFLYLCILFQMEAYFNLTMFYMVVVFGFCAPQWVDQIDPPEQQEKMTVYVCETMYHVLLATLLLKGTRNIIVCTTHEKKNMENFRGLHTKQIPQAHFLMRYRDPKKESLGIEMLKDRSVLERLRRHYGFVRFDLVNFAWNRNSIDRSSAWYYKQCDSAVFYEEGAMGCIGIPQSWKKLLVKRVLGIPVRFHKDRKLQGVYVQDPSLYDDRFGEKLRSFDLRSLMENSQVGHRVVDLFLTEEKARMLAQMDGKSIVFTQPLSEDGYISRQRKEEIYGAICGWFQPGHVVLKVHPRDTSDYENVGCGVLRENFPGELFDVLQIRFDAAVGLCTSAVNNVDAVHPVNLNSDFLKDTRFSYEDMCAQFQENGVLKS